MTIVRAENKSIGTTSEKKGLWVGDAQKSCSF